jgi:hypothetical protein
MFISHSEIAPRASTVSVPAELDLDLGIVTIEDSFARAPYGSPRMNTAAQRTVPTVAVAPVRG